MSVKQLLQLQERRCMTYNRLDALHRGHLGGTSSDTLFTSLSKQMTEEFNAINQSIRQLQSDSDDDAFSVLIDTLQNLERQHLQTVSV